MSNSITAEIMKQSQDAFGDNFICKTCQNYKSGCGCGKNIFIAFVGANMSSCIYYLRGKEYPHCGRIA